MEKSTRTIIVTNDLDGIHFKAPTPMGTLIELAMHKRLTIPGEGDVLRPYVEPYSLIDKGLTRMDQLFHQFRPIEPQGHEVLERMYRIGMYCERNIGFNALSGRELHLHKITKSRLEDGEYLEFFGDDLLLNPGKGSALWKRQTGKELLGYGLNMVHIEDDVKAGIAVASLSPVNEEQRILVYLKKGLSNHPRLLERAGIVLPPNIIMFKSITEIPSDFRGRMERGEI